MGMTKMPIFGPFFKDILVDLFWSLHAACLWHVQFGFSHGTMDQINSAFNAAQNLKKNLPQKEKQLNF